MLVCSLFPPMWHMVAVWRDGSSFLGKGRIENQGDMPRHQFQGYQHRLNQLQSNSFVTSQRANKLQVLSSSFSLELLAQPCSLYNGNHPSNYMAETWAAHQMPWHSPTPCKWGHLTNSGQWTMMQRTCVPFVPKCLRANEHPSRSAMVTAEDTHWDVISLCWVEEKRSGAQLSTNNGWTLTE